MTARIPLKIKLGRWEEKIHDAFLQKKLNCEGATIDDIAKVGYGQAKRPVHWRNTVAARMRGLCLKTAAGAGEMRIERRSSLGRSAKATYSAFRKPKVV